MQEETERIGGRLNELLVEADLEPLNSGLALCLADFCALLLRWNSRINLTAIRNEDEILRRHFVESIFCARALPGTIGTLLDLGSGAGFPGLVIALCCPQVSVTLAESQQKKAAFLQEAIRVTGAGARVHAGRAEAICARFDCVTLRAVDRMERAVATAAGLVELGGVLGVMTTGAGSRHLQKSAGQGFNWELPLPLPWETERVLALGNRRAE